ncbi:MAG: O-methyltransferase [Methylococcales bacterium]
MRSYKHWTPRYIADRLALMVYERKRPDAPWLTRSMIDILETWLRPGDVGLEFGSGRSTVWFARRVAHLTSVEHDPKWYSKVAGDLRDAGVAERVDYRLLGDGQTDASASAYVRVTSEMPPDSLDFFLVDGVMREHCALASLDKIKPGGILIVDNIEWYMLRENRSSAPGGRCLREGFASEGWKQCAESLKEWRCIWTSNGVWDTALWVNPAVEKQPK